MRGVAKAETSDYRADRSGCLVAVFSVGIAALNLLFGVFNEFLNGGYLGSLAADAYNHHVPVLARAGARVDALILAGLVTLVGSGIALARLGRPTRGWVIVGVVANLASMSLVMAAFASGIDIGE